MGGVVSKSEWRVKLGIVINMIIVYLLLLAFFSFVLIRFEQHAYFTFCGSWTAMSSWAGLLSPVFF